EVALLQAEMTVHKSMNDLLLAARKPKIKHPVGDLPMNQAFWALVEKNMTRGEIREEFFEDKGASKMKELQYIPEDAAFMGWQQMLFQMEQTKKADKQMAEQAQAQQQQMQAESEAASHQKDLDEGEHQRNEEKHDAEMNQLKGQAAFNAVQHSKSTADIAKETGNTSSNFIGGKNTKNPLND
ncbi:MAG: hypothetical protein ACTSU6_03985, partial [Candidatus Njordarchaeales archaeon]